MASYFHEDPFYPHGCCMATCSKCSSTDNTVMEPLNAAEGTGDKKHPSNTLPSSLSDKRGKWAHKREFILAVIGEIIGLGNVCRFPYLCFKNGGGAFLIPYAFFLVTCGIPIFFLEVSLGQLTSQGGITCWRKICPLLEGVGYGSQVMVFYSGVYYIVILAWAFLFLFHCFHAELPWTSCNNTWNTVNCAVNQLNHSVNGSASMNVTSSVVEFWQRRVLGLSRGIEEMGDVRWDLAGCLLLSWIICYFCIWKGVKTSGKVVYFTATFPYLMLITLLIRGVTLPGAARGIYFYLYPDLSRLADFQVWMDAGSQVLFSCAVCLGCLPSLGSYNEYKNNCYRDAYGLCLLNSLTSIVSGFAVFSVLGFMAHKLGLDISEVAESGPGLAFIAYPQALAMMPLPQLWAILFFLMIIFLGLDSQFVCLEGLVTSIADMYPSVFFLANRRKILLLIICVLSFFVDFFMVTEGGLYLFQLFEYYGCGGIPLITFVFLEAVTIGWMYGADKYYTNIADMIGYRPSPYMKYCWKYATPCFAMAILLFILAKFRPLKYNYTYEYPWWAYSFGLLLAFSSILMVPLWALYILIKTPGTLRQKIKVVMTPADGLLRRQPKECKGLTSDTNL